MAGPFIPIMWISTSTSPHTILLDWQVAVTLERDPGLRGGSVIYGQAVSQPLVSSVTPLRDRVGPTVHILNSYWTKMWKPAPCGSILRSSSAPLPSRLVQSIFFLLSLYLLCGHGLLSALLPWLHVSALAPAGPGFVLLLLEGAGSRPGPVLCWHFSGTTSWGAGPWSEFKAAELPQLSLNCFLLSLSSVHPQRFITLEIYQVDTNRKWSFLVRG